MTAAPAKPTVFILFGSTGDLAARMVLPAFYQLFVAGLLPEHWTLIGNGRHPFDDDAFRTHTEQAITTYWQAPNPAQWAEFASHVRYAGKGFSVDDAGELPTVLADVTGGADAQLILYVALPPTVFGDYTRAIGAHGLAKGSRVVYEKPFGTSPESFAELSETVSSIFDESQVYRIDHFLGKESTQNLHVLRFANGLFERTWNNGHVKQVQIDVPETLDINDRAAFYDQTGAVLDMLVTHLFQVAAEVAMEPPASLNADDLQSARESVIAAFRPLDPAETVLGQYEGYRDVPGIAADSTTDTFVATTLWVDNERWQGVPFLLRTGKRLNESSQTVTVVFRQPERGPIHPLLADGTSLSFDLSGNGAIHLCTTIKQPGPGMPLTRGAMNLQLGSLPDAAPLAPYARLLLDIMNGDRSLFTRPDGLADVWKVANPLLTSPPAVQPYAQGSTGPAAADALPGEFGWLSESTDWA